MGGMDYIELTIREKKWAPHTYAWKCVSCVKYPVYVLDGDIDPEAKRWERRRREFERKELLSAVGAIAFKKRTRRECPRVLQDGRNQPEQSAEVEPKDHLKKDTASA